MNNILELDSLIRKYSESQKGVFTLGDLKSLFNDFDELTLFRKINKLIKNNILSKFLRGFYVIKNFSIEMLSSVIFENSYISLNSVLAKELIIGSVPGYKLYCIKLGKNREYKCGDFSIKYFSISDNMFFGFKKVDGINFADAEKAFIDTLYFHQKGNKFSFDIYSDINIKKLNINLIYQYLSEYINPKFISFVKRYIDERI